MKKTKIIQIDGRYPDYRARELEVYLQDGWEIMDKVVIRDRYVNYILAKNEDLDVGKCSYEIGLPPNK